MIQTQMCVGRLSCTVVDIGVGTGHSGNISDGAFKCSTSSLMVMDCITQIRYEYDMLYIDMSQHEAEDEHV